MALNDGLYHKRLNDFETFDRVEMKVVPRWKTSGLSGNEWRQHYQVDCYFKGEKVAEYGCRDLQWAIILFHSKFVDQPISDRHLELERLHCDQPSCLKKPAVRAFIKKEYSRQGEPIEKETSFRYYRQFCLDHKHRGDCSREDRDDNYEFESLEHN